MIRKVSAPAAIVCRAVAVTSVKHLNRGVERKQWKLTVTLLNGGKRVSVRQVIWPILAIVLIACGVLASHSEPPYRAATMVSQLVLRLWEPAVCKAETAESSTTVKKAPSTLDTSWYGTRVPHLSIERKLPAWPPRFDDNSSGNLVGSGSRDSDQNSVGDSGIRHQPSGDQQQLYPATGRPELVWGTTPLVAVLDPMEAEAVPLTNRVGSESVKTTSEPDSQPAANSVAFSTQESNSVVQAPKDERSQVDPASDNEVMVSDLSQSRWPNDTTVQAAMAKIENAPSFAPEVCEQTTVLARVGTDIILAGEILGAVNEMLTPYRDKVPGTVFEEYKQQLMRRLLMQRVEMKLVYQDAKRHLPPEAIEHFEQEVGKLFDEKELPDRLKKMGLSTPQEFDTRLKGLGSSLAHEKRAFIEAVIAREWLRQKTQGDTGPLATASPEELLAYYQSHIQEFEEPGWVEWQQLMVRKRRDRSDADAYARASALREQVLAGQPFETVARAGSEGPTAASGGLRERTYRGSLRSKILEDALFSLPVGSVSSIIEDDQGFHVVRIIQRQETRRVPFTEAQVQIREKLAQERRRQMTQQWLAKLSQEIPVWTIYDEMKSPVAPNN